MKNYPLFLLIIVIILLIEYIAMLSYNFYQISIFITPIIIMSFNYKLMSFSSKNRIKNTLILSSILILFDNLFRHFLWVYSTGNLDNLLHPDGKSIFVKKITLFINLLIMSIYGLILAIKPKRSL
jgi:hypothetical protein